MPYQKFEKGEIVRLDSKFNHTSMVTVISQTPLLMYTRIKDEYSDWEVMTNRLTKIDKEEL